MTFLLHFHDHTSGIPFLLFNLFPCFLKNFHCILSSSLSHMPLIAIMKYKSFGEYSIKQKNKCFIVPVALFLWFFLEFSSCSVTNLHFYKIWTQKKVPPTFLFNVTVFIFSNSWYLRRFIILLSCVVLDSN